MYDALLENHVFPLPQPWIGIHTQDIAEEIFLCSLDLSSQGLIEHTEELQDKEFKNLREMKVVCPLYWLYELPQVVSDITPSLGSIPWEELLISTRFCCI